jgi:hypothetical protein
VRNKRRKIPAQSTLNLNSEIIVPTRLIDGSLSIIQRLTDLLGPDKISESIKRRITDMLSDLLDGELLAFITVSSFSLCSSGAVLAGSSKQPLLVVFSVPADLFSALTALCGNTRRRLCKNAHGLLGVIKKNFGENV